MALTQRDEFASVIQRGGGRVEALLVSLRERIGER
jgi:phospholipid transport system substrate-binding protein